MTHGVDVDYTQAINFLAGHGYDELMKSGFNSDLLRRLDRKGRSDEETSKALSEDWSKGTMPGLPARETELKKDRVRSKVAPATQPPKPANPELKTVSVRCFKCKRERQIKDPHVETMKNGRAIRGVCPVCGSGMYHLGIPS